MLSRYLQGSINDIKALIALTEEDIRDIKEAKHDLLFSRIEEKNNLVSSFELNKSKAHSELSNLLSSVESKPSNLSSVLKSEEMDLISSLKDALNELQEKNLIYARMSLAVGEFYSSLASKIDLNMGGKYSKSSFISCEA